MNQETITKDEAKEIMKEIMIVAAYPITDAIKEARQIPSGRIYAMVMDLLNPEQYETIIDVLCEREYITKKHNLLCWNA